MRILFIVENPLLTDVIRNALADLAEKESIFFVNDFSTAEAFVNNRLHARQEGMDLIICHDEIAGQIALDFRKTLVADPSRTYSNSDFNLDRLPVILLVPPRNHLTFYRRQGFSATLSDLGAEHLAGQVREIAGVIRSWRKGVVDELDNLGIQFNSGIVDYDYYFNRRKRFIATRILSENFQLFPRKLSYYWLERNQRQIELAIDEYASLLKRTHQGNRKREEKLYHQFFNRNKFFIERDAYSKSWYEQKLPYERRKSYQPDYSLKTNLNYTTDLNILEVKLPNESFIKNTKFHPGFYSKLVDHLTQINDYKDYLEDQEFREIVEKKYGWYPERIQYSLLMGRQTEKEEHQHLLAKRIRQFHQEKIYLMTYDELLDYQLRFFDRMRLLDIN